jgi:tripartite-type tricarboxylate transporter receptor subunit TctC
MIGKSRAVSRTLFAAVFSLAASGAAMAQAPYPSKAIHIVVPIPPGAAADVLPRMVAAKLSEKWGQPVIIDNRPGAAQNLGAASVARSTPDGYTLLAAPPPPLAINQHLYSKLEYDPNTFIPLSILATLPNVLVASPDGPIATLKDLVTLGKERPGKLSYASGGIGTTPHLAMEWLQQLTGTTLNHVPYNGNAPALVDVLGGRVNVMFDNAGNILPLIKDKRLKALAVTSAQRIDELPDTPTIAETYSSFIATTWFAMAAPAGTPPDIVDKLSAEIARAMREPDISAYLRSISAVVAAGTPAETLAFVRKEADQWGRTIKTAGIKGE